ncbi:MAG TPA: hypothetical protein VFN67_19970 [Polyangiales bacterium]|nr:hypothetical protein [Polyangiales bacterium]
MSLVSNPTRRTLSWLVALLALCMATVARAQPSDAQVQQARVLGRDAMALMQKQDYVGAERLLSAALALHPAPTLHLLRGEAREHQNKLLAATTDYQAAVQFPVASDEHPKYAQARGDAQAHLSQLPELIPSLTLRAVGKLTRATVNGVAWPVDALPLSRALDPGVYTILAVDGDGNTQKYRVTLTQRAHETLELSGTLPPTAAEATPAPKAARIDYATAAHTARYTLAALTLGFTAAALITGIVALNKRGDYHDHNRAEVAMDEKLRLRSAASTWGWVSTALTGAAIAGAGTIVYLMVVPENPSGTATALQLTATGSF